MVAGLRRLGVPVRRGVRGLRALGRRRVESVAWDGGEIAADHLLLHEGVIPNTQISLALQLAHAGTRRNCAGAPRSTNGAARACRPSRSPAMAPASPEPRRRCSPGGSPRSTPRICWAVSTRRSATAGRRRCARTSRAKRAIRPFLDALYRPADPVLCPRRRRHRLPLRRGHGRPDPPRRPPRRAGAEPGQGLHPLRHGAVSGPPLRSGRERGHRPRPRRADRGGRRVPPARALQADHPGRAGRDRAAPGCRRAATAATRSHHADGPIRTSLVDKFVRRAGRLCRGLSRRS